MTYINIFSRYKVFFSHMPFLATSITRNVAANEMLFSLSSLNFRKTIYTIETVVIQQTN